jgi:hypothetical protein
LWISGLPLIARSTVSEVIEAPMPSAIAATISRVSSGLRRRLSSARRR